jgi:predicted Zn-dependent protease
MISTQRHLEYTQGYLMLGLVEEAAAELELIPDQDALSDNVLEVAIDVYSMQQRWNSAVTAAQEYARRNPDEPKGWISWAFALRRLKSIQEAEAVLLEGEKRVGNTCALIHYNLACYRCQLGDKSGAMERLTTACRMEPVWKQSALADPDLAPLKDEIAAMDFA